MGVPVSLFEKGGFRGICLWRKAKDKFAGAAGQHVLLLRQKKVTKEKATQVRRPFGLPCGTRSDGRLRYSPFGAQTVLADFPCPVSVPRRTHMGKAPKSPSDAPSQFPFALSLSKGRTRHGLVDRHSRESGNPGKVNAAAFPQNAESPAALPYNNATAEPRLAVIETMRLSGGIGAIGM
jgi:hypothetical protein